MAIQTRSKHKNKELNKIIERFNLISDCHDELNGINIRAYLDKHLKEFMPARKDYVSMYFIIVGLIFVIVPLTFFISYNLFGNYILQNDKTTSDGFLFMFAFLCVSTLFVLVPLIAAFMFNRRGRARRIVLKFYYKVFRVRKNDYLLLLCFNFLLLFICVAMYFGAVNIFTIFLLFVFTAESMLFVCFFIIYINILIYRKSVAYKTKCEIRAVGKMIEIIRRADRYSVSNHVSFRDKSKLTGLIDDCSNYLKYFEIGSHFLSLSPYREQVNLPKKDTFETLSKNMVTVLCNVIRGRYGDLPDDLFIKNRPYVNKLLILGYFSIPFIVFYISKLTNLIGDDKSMSVSFLIFYSVWVIFGIRLNKEIKFEDVLAVLNLSKINKKSPLS